MEHYSAINKMEILPFVTMWMNLEGIKWKNQTVKDKYWMISLIGGIFFKYLLNLHSLNRYREQIGNYQKEG